LVLEVARETAIYQKCHLDRRHISSSLFRFFLFSFSIILRFSLSLLYFVSLFLSFFLSCFLSFFFRSFHSVYIFFVLYLSFYLFYPRISFVLYFSVYLFFVLSFSFISFHSIFDPPQVRSPQATPQSKGMVPQGRRDALQGCRRGTTSPTSLYQGEINYLCT
jgi:hypothetical protein